MCNYYFIHDSSKYQNSWFKDRVLCKLRYLFLPHSFTQVSEGSIIQFTFTEYDIGFDAYTQLYDGENVNAPFLQRGTGNTIPSSLTSTTNQLTFKYVAGSNSKGFKASFRTGILLVQHFWCFAFSTRKVNNRCSKNNKNANIGALLSFSISQEHWQWTVLKIKAEKFVGCQIYQRKSSRCTFHELRRL